MSLDTIFIIFIPKISMKKTLNSKFVQLKQTRIKVVIIVALKPDPKKN